MIELCVSSPASEGAPGVYGMRIRGLSETPLLARVPVNAPVLDLSFELGLVRQRDEEFGRDRAEIALLGGGWVSLSRAGRAHFVMPHEVEDEEVLHPWLVPAAATFNGWCGRQVLHGGAFCRGGSGVALLGEKEDGKSSLLAWLSQRDDLEVLADDLVVIDGRDIYVGPRCIDLRPGAAEALAASRPRLVRDDERLRLILGSCPPTADLRAIVILAWGDELTLRRLGAAEGLSAVLPHAMNGGTAAHLLGLLDVPVWRLVRPRSWDIMDATADELERLLEHCAG